MTRVIDQDVVSRSTTERQILDLQNAESATTWILSFVAKCRAEKKEDKINTDGTVQDLQARRRPLPLQDKVTEKLKQMVKEGIVEPVQLGGVTNASPMAWQRKKSGELRLCVDLKVHINGKAMDEVYPIPDMETIFHNLHSASYFGKIDLSDAY